MMIQMVCVLLRVPVILLIHMSREFGFACVGVLACVACCCLFCLLRALDGCKNASNITAQTHFNIVTFQKEFRR